MKKTCLMVALCVCLSAAQAFPAEMGRRDMSGQPGGSAIETTKTYNDFLGEGTLGLDVSAVWKKAQWKVVTGGTESHDDSVWEPQVSVFYGMDNFLDVRLSYEPFSLSEGPANLDVTRLGIGARARKCGTDFIPFAEILINYYILSSDNMNDLNGTFGISGEVGITYQVSDFFFVNVGAPAETFLTRATGKDALTGDDARLSFNSFGLGVGVTVLF